MKTLSFLFLSLCCVFSYAQQPPSTLAKDRLANIEKRKALLQNSIAANIPFESVGPSVFSGRVTDVAVNPNDPSHFYVAYASGGLWKTTSNGSAFTPLFDDEVVMTIGDIAVDWNQNVIWIGTGENNSSRSSYSGLGMFKSEDGGETWQHKGLEESHHIGRIIMHPTNPSILWVAVLGHLYSPNQERGIYKTTDGGETWKQTLFVNENAGAVDLIIDPSNPNILYTATWERERRAWNFVESGEGSGIYKSVDGGTTWTLLTDEKSGFPTGEGVGRIGLSITKENGKTILYSILDNYFRRPEEKKEDDDILVKEDFRTMTAKDFLKLDKEKLKDFLKDNNFPEKYSTEKVFKMIRKEKIKPIAFVEYLENANALLFDTPVIAAEVYRSDDEGKTWKKTHEDYLNNLYNSYGYYFGQIRISPHDANKIYIFGVPILISEDAGKTFKSINGKNVHVDHHALWLNPKRDKHLILGNDGGINISYDDGESWFKCNSPAVGQFYSVNVDMEEPYNIYGGLQDNGVWIGPSNYKASHAWHNSGQYPYKSILGGDGMHIEIDTRNNNTIYTGFQFGNYFRINRRTGQRDYITPMHELGDRPYRWNWQSPIHLSIHNQDILYVGSNVLHRSMNQGKDFKTISDDLTGGGIKGDVAYSTLSSIHESPLKFGLIYTGSDDGFVHVSKDGGNTWNQINEGLPKRMWVTRIKASAFDEATVYLAMNGYRWDDFNTYLFRSTNYGTTWEAIGNDLPNEPINVVKEDPKTAGMLYVGTDHGLYVSLDNGDTFMQMNEGLPAVAVHDLVIHPTKNDLVIGTHGRSFYKASVKELQELDEEIMENAIYAFEIEPITFSPSWGKIYSQWSEPNVRKIKIPFYAKNAGSMTISIKTDTGLLLKEIPFQCKKGINYVEYDLSVEEGILKKYEAFLNQLHKTKDKKKIKIKKADDGQFYLYTASYIVDLKKDGEGAETELEIVEK